MYKDVTVTQKYCDGYGNQVPAVFIGHSKIT